MYDDIDYARTRLLNTVIRDNNGEPIMVRDLGYDEDDDGIILIFNFLSDPYSAYGRINLYEANLKPVPLGYLNTSYGSSHYLSRIPVREDWRQGLRPNNMGVQSKYNFSDNNMYSETIFMEFLPQLGKVIRGEYPSFEESLDRVVNQKYEHVAFSRKFSIYRGLVDDNKFPLIYKGTHIIGNITKDGKIDKIYDDKKYLSEYLEECLEGKV